MGSFSDQTFTYVLFLCFCQIFPAPIGFFLVRADEQSACYFRHIITSGRFYVLPVVPVYLRMVLFQAIYNSLVIADMINHKEITVDAQLTQLCLDNIFGINKLLPVFEDFFDV